MNRRLLVLSLLVAACGARSQLVSSESAVGVADAGADSAPKPPACTRGPAQSAIRVSDGTLVVAALAVDDDDAYFVVSNGTTSTLRAAPKRGGGRARSIAAIAGADALLVDETAVYVLSLGGGIERVPKGGGAPAPLVKPEVASMALDGDSLYYTTFASVMRMPKTGGASSVVVRGEQGKLVREVRVAGGALFWLSDAADVFTAAKDGSGPRSLVHGNQIDDYFVDGTRVYAWDRERSGAALLLAAPIGGGGATTLVTGVTTAAPVVAGGAADGNGVIYWSGGYGPGAQGLLETSKTGGATSAVWSGQPGFAVVADDACVYWIAGEDVLRVAK